MLSVDNMEPATAVATLRQALEGLNTLSGQRAALEEALKVGLECVCAAGPAGSRAAGHAGGASERDTGRKQKSAISPCTLPGMAGTHAPCIHIHAAG